MYNPTVPGAAKGEAAAHPVPLASTLHCFTCVSEQELGLKRTVFPEQEVSPEAEGRTSSDGETPDGSSSSTTLPEHTGGGAAVTVSVKGGTASRLVVPEVPRIGMVYGPTGVVRDVAIVRTEVHLLSTLGVHVAGSNVHVMPFAGYPGHFKSTDCAVPEVLVTVTVGFGKTVLPCLALSDVGLTVTVKSNAETLTVKVSGSLSPSSAKSSSLFLSMHA